MTIPMVYTKCRIETEKRHLTPSQECDKMKRVGTMTMTKLLLDSRGSNVLGDADACVENF